MKVSPFLEEIFELVAIFLDKSGQQSLAGKLRKQYQLPQWVHNNNPLLQKGLAKIVKDYVKLQPKLLKYYQQRKEDQPSQEDLQEEQIVKKQSKPKNKAKSPAQPAVSPKVTVRKSPRVQALASPKNITSSWMSKFEKPKRLQEIDGQLEQVVEQAQPTPKKEQKSKKQKKKIEVSSSDYESQEDSFELEPKKKSKKIAKAEKIQAKAAIKPQQQKKQIVKEEAKPWVRRKAADQSEPYNNTNAPKKFFSRINPQQIGPIKDELKDNSFEAKARYGQANDDWGMFGHDKLKDTRGQSFKKTKGKLKNRAFQGALMDINKINSIPIY